MATREAVEERLDAAVRDWDVHLDRCPECLAYGEHLCAEGEYSAIRIEAARSTLDRLAFKEARAALVRGAPAAAGRTVPRGARPA